MSIKLQSELAALGDMSVGQLRDRYQEVFGEIAWTRNKQFLCKRVAWRIQALAEGDLSERARRRAEETANDADLHVRAPRKVSTALEPERTVTATVQSERDPRLPLPGTVLKRKYKGQMVRALVLGNIFSGQRDRILCRGEYLPDGQRSRTAACGAGRGKRVFLRTVRGNAVLRCRTFWMQLMSIG